MVIFHRYVNATRGIERFYSFVCSHPLKIQNKTGSLVPKKVKKHPQKIVALEVL